MRNAVDSINIKEIINVANTCGCFKYKHLGLIDLSPYHNSIWSPFSSLGISSESNHHTIILFEAISLAKFNKLGFVPSHLFFFFILMKPVFLEYLRRVVELLTPRCTHNACRRARSPLTLLIFMLLNSSFSFLCFICHPPSEPYHSSIQASPLLN